MSGIDRLLEIMARLRDPAGGCPWDLAQDFASISRYTIEEAYEVDEAIAQGDLDALRDELGDLLFQVVFQARIAEERGAFDFEAVTEAIRSKLVRRHPHVFADAAVPGTVEAQTASWESMKAAEREAARGGAAGSPTPVDPFDGIPRNLPALARSAKIAGRLARLESEGPSPPRARSGAGDGEAPDSAREQARAATVEVRRLLEELGSQLAGIEPRSDRDGALDRVGRGLQAWVELARALGVDPEQALRRADDARIASIRVAHASGPARPA